MHSIETYTTIIAAELRRREQTNKAVLSKLWIETADYYKKRRFTKNTAEVFADRARRDAALEHQQQNQALQWALEILIGTLEFTPSQAQQARDEINRTLAAMRRAKAPQGGIWAALKKYFTAKTAHAAHT